MQLIRCRIQLLDGTDVEQQFDKTSLGQIVYDFACDHLNLVERDYFGCSYIEDDTKFWLRLDKKLSKQTKGDFILNFEVKFYPFELMRMKDEIARSLLFLQIRRDILFGKLPASFVSQVLLGALAAQSQSSYDNLINNDNNLSSQPAAELMDKISDMQQIFNGLSQSEAEYNFIDNARLLSMYGVHKHPAKNLDGQEVIIGVHAKGLLIFVGAVVIRKIIWAKMIKIYYKKTKFFIRIRKEQHEVKDYNLTYKLDTVAKTRNLWRLAMEHHTFFRLKEASDISLSWYRGGHSKVSYPGKTLQQTSTYDFIRTIPKNSDYYANYKPSQLGTERGEELIAEVIKPSMLTLRMKGNTSRSTIGNMNDNGTNNLDLTQPVGQYRTPLDLKSLDSSIDIRSNHTNATLPRNYPQPANTSWINPGFEPTVLYNDQQNVLQPYNITITTGNGNFPLQPAEIAPKNDRIIRRSFPTEDADLRVVGYSNAIRDYRVEQDGHNGYTSVRENYENEQEGQGQEFNPYDDIGSDFGASSDNSEEERILASAIQRVTNMDENFQVNRIEVYTGIQPYSDI